ncbi:MAG: HAMP domain-containing histidine kinase [Agarilytica sp.]
MSDEQNIDFSLVIASSVHDMKNSIGMLLASLEGVIQDTPPQNEDQEKRFNTLHYEASRINSELIQLLTIYRMQNDFLPTQIDEHYVIDVLEDQVARNHMLLETGGVELSMACSEDLHWYYDDDLIGSVVHNVFVNCIRYTKSVISLQAEIKGEFLCITIEDDGPGYPDHMLEKPSDLVNDAQVSRGNTHLGLYFAEQIALMHKQNNRHGYIELENGGTLGGGVFRIYLP